MAGFRVTKIKRAGCASQHRNEVRSCQKKATEFQRKAMSRMYRGKEIFKPLNTGWIDENVACVREWVANIFFYRKGDTTIMIDAGYNYDRLAEKMHWLGIGPHSIRHILRCSSGA